MGCQGFGNVCVPVPDCHIRILQPLERNAAGPDGALHRRQANPLNRVERGTAWLPSSSEYEYGGSACREVALVREEQQADDTRQHLQHVERQYDYGADAAVWRQLSEADRDHSAAIRRVRGLF